MTLPLRSNSSIAQVDNHGLAVSRLRHHLGQRLGGKCIHWPEAADLQIRHLALHLEFGQAKIVRPRTRNRHSRLGRWWWRLLQRIKLNIHQTVVLIRHDRVQILLHLFRQGFFLQPGIVAMLQVTSQTIGQQLAFGRENVGILQLLRVFFNQLGARAIVKFCRLYHPAKLKAASSTMRENGIISAFE
ncbi:hypothetical protein [Duganella levis]|uniref:hypothetical protein n=1 Tax=Duganella levis TaxID=2692169 RepID=UPI001E5CF775|nr:hypothetical protein [Duganella levis]